MQPDSGEIQLQCRPVEEELLDEEVFLVHFGRRNDPAGGQRRILEQAKNRFPFSRINLFVFGFLFSVSCATLLR